MKITLMAFGSRGDIQPFLALAVALRGRGHQVTLAAPDDFEAQINAFAVPYARIPISIARYMQHDVTKRIMQKGITPALLVSFWREIIPELKGDLQHTAQVVSKIAKDSDLLISHGFLISFAYAIHQQLGIPLLLGIAAPIVPTRLFASPMFPPIPFGQRYYNPLTYHGLLRLIISFMNNPMNAYRRSVGLPTMSTGQVIRVLFSGQFPILMHYSRHLLPVPSDWGANVHVVGSWPLLAPEDWTPPEALSAFLAQGEAPVFLGFGSMPIPNPTKMAQTIVEALRLAKLRGVLQAGWAGLSHKNTEDEHLLAIGEAPHEWLFPRMAAMVHHGGSGTTHSALSAGKPSLIVPFMADQPFWSRRLVELGVGLPPIAPKKITPARLAEALRTLTQDSALQQRAAELGSLLRAEDGLGATCDLVLSYTS